MKTLKPRAIEFLRTVRWFEEYRWPIEPRHLLALRGGEPIEAAQLDLLAVVRPPSVG